MNSIGGFGNCRFVYGGIDVTITGQGYWDYETVDERLVNDNFRISSRVHGLRAKVYTDKLYNLETDDWQDYRKLMNIISAIISSTEQRVVTIYPRYDASYDNVSFDCILDSPISIRDIARTEVGQLIKSIRWLAVDLQGSASSLIHSTSESITDEDGIAITDEDSHEITD